jgi:phenylacetate-CoA ligase
MSSHDPDVGIGEKPHERPVTDLMKAYARGVGVVAPQLMLNPWLPSKVLRAITFRRMRDIVQHAMTHVPWYREQLTQAGVRPDKLRSEAAIAEIPFLTKANLREHAGEILSEDAGPKKWLLARHTTGSSGVPIQIYFEAFRELPRRAQELRLLTANGFRPWYRQMIMTHPQHVPSPITLPQRLGIWRHDVFPWWLDTDAAVERVREEKPEVIHGVLSSLRLLALAVRKSGGLGYKLKLAVSKGEWCADSTRALIEEQFGTRLTDYYATEETGIVAWQCPRGDGYHIDSDLVYVEVVDTDGKPVRPGESGEIVLTNLYQKTMPIIRYRIGDMGSISESPCPCGRGLPVLKTLEGRRLDYVMSPDGTIHHPFELIAVMEEIREFKMFRIAQTAPDELRVEICWSPDQSAEVREQLTRKTIEKMEKVVGPGMRILAKPNPDLQVGIGEKFPLVRGLPGITEKDVLRRGYSVHF